MPESSNRVVPGPVTNSFSQGPACTHCRQPLNSPQERSSGFCCLGCHAAHDFINSLGLGFFYELRARDSEWAAKPVVARPSKYSHFDDALFEKSFIVEESVRQSRLNFQLPGIHCAACVWLLEKLPEVISGVLHVRVDLVRGTAVVRFDPEAIKPSKVAQAFAALGYVPHPVPVDAGKSAELRHDRLFAAQLGVAAFAAMNVMALFFARHQGYLTSMEHSYAALIAWTSLFLSIPVVTFSALPFYKTSLASLKHRRLHIDLPIAIAVVGGFVASAVNTALGREEIYFDTVTALVFLLLLGRWVQRFMMKRVGNATDLLHSLAPLVANRLDVNGDRQEVYIGSLAAGDTVIVDDGAYFPCDGILVAGRSHVDNSILTGESAVTPIEAGMEVFAGTKNFGAEVRVRVSAVGSSTRLGKLVEQIQCSPARESRIARFVDRISIFFVIGVLALAVFTFILWIDSGFWAAWDRVISLLVVSCPCALGIATPITLSLAGMRAARRGILLKDGEALERLASAREVIFDKTGTLTCGELGVARSELLTTTSGWDEVWSLVAELERGVAHPVAAALWQTAVARGAASLMLSEKGVETGAGVYGIARDSSLVRLGSLSWLRSNGIHFSEHAQTIISRLSGKAYTLVGMSQSRELIALFALGDRLRPEAISVVRDLAKRSVAATILSGDSRDVVEEIAQRLGIGGERRYAQASPEQKADFVRSRGEAAVFVGDGANDGLALSRAGVGIGIKGGAEICMAVSDIFLLRPDLSLIVEAIDGAKATLRQIHRHLLISLLYNIVAATFAVSGHIGPLAAALVMPLSSFTVLASSVWGAPFRERRG